MKKKLLFIPIITLIVSVLSGCNWFKPQEVDPIYLDSWLDSAKTPDKDPNAPEVWYQDEDEKTHSCYDFGLEIRDAIKSKVKNVSPSQVKECKESTKTAIGYKIHTSFARFNSCLIYINEDGYVCNSNFGSGWGAPKSQHFLYDIGKAEALELITTIKTRVLEIETKLKEEKEASTAMANLDNFFKQIEDSNETPTIVYRETRPEHDFYEGTTYDENLALLSSFKDLEYEALDDYSVDILPMIKYYISEDWRLQIYCGYGYNYNIASISYKYQGQFKTYYPSYYLYYYSINAAKAEVIADTIRNSDKKI